MIPHQEYGQPPRAAAWLLGLFADGEEKELVLGDLSEEYFQRLSQAGQTFARRWYWRQIVKSLPHLAGLSFRASPVTTILAVAGGFELRRLMAPRIEPALFAFIRRTQIYEHHFSLYLFLTSTGIDIAHLLTFLLVGAAVALIARRRAMAPAVVLGLIYAGMALVAAVLFVIRSQDYGYLLRLSWYFSDAFAIVLGAALVRTIRTNQQVSESAS